jgi:predicted small integral membrane protein
VGWAVTVALFLQETVMIIRLAKILLPLSLAAFTCLVTVNNIVDYCSNFIFVRHVLSMDTTFPGNGLMGRAITERIIWHISYWFIVACEGATSILLLWGVCKLWQARHADATIFNGAKNFVVLGCVTGFLLWFCGFMVIGGEWFAMWQSKIWNGQTAAFRFYMTVLGVLIFVCQPDCNFG